MSRIKGKDTKPEKRIRNALHAEGLRYRLHQKDLPGKPDMVFRKYSTVVFIHGCFWHGHDCHLFKKPSTRQDFWLGKIEGNKKRDIKAIQTLNDEGWKVAVIWECSMRGPGRQDFEKLVRDLCAFIRTGTEIVKEFQGTDT